MKTLYHASTNKGLALIEPQPTEVDGSYIGDYIFATANKAYAAMYLAPKGCPQLLSVFRGKPYFIINDTPESFCKRDKGGAIYELPADSFSDSPQLELRETEQASMVSVCPVAKQTYETSLEALQELKVPLYFVNDGTFRSIQQADDHGWSIIQGLQSYQMAK